MEADGEDISQDHPEWCEKSLADEGNSGMAGMCSFSTAAITEFRVLSVAPDFLQVAISSSFMGVAPR